MRFNLVAGTFIFSLLFPAVAFSASCCVCVEQPSDLDQGGFNYNWDEGRVFQDITDDTSERCTKDKKEEIMMGGLTPYICAIKEIKRCEKAEPPKTMTSFADEFKIKDIFLGVVIPSLKFSAPPSEVDESGNIYIPWLAEYLKAIYNYAVVIISIIGVVAIIVQGIRVITSAGGPTKADAYKKITQIFIGLFIAWGSYTILYVINPGLTAFKPLAIKYVEPEELPIDDPDDKNPDMGGIALPGSDLALARKSGPRMDAVGDLPTKGEKVEKCNVIDQTEFEKYLQEKDIMSKFSDGSNGACLIGLYNSGEITRVSFLGRTLQTHSTVAEALSTVAETIRGINSPIVNYWKEDGRFATAGSYVNDSDKTRYRKKCKQASRETVVVVNSKGVANRLYTSIARVMYGGKDSKTIVGGDMHSLGMAIDVYAKMNLDFKGLNKPLVTNVPKEVADAFMNNNFVWGGGHWGRDAMHFEYRNQSCYTKAVTAAYPTGNGCCVVVDFEEYMKSKGAKELPSYAQCMSMTGAKDATYENCMGPSGAPGSMWVQQTMQ